MYVCVRTTVKSIDVHSMGGKKPVGTKIYSYASQNGSGGDDFVYKRKLNSLYKSKRT